MPDTIVKKRVHRLERLMEQLITTVDRVDRQIEQTQRNLDQLSQEHREFKDEMRDFKDEMRDFKDEMRGFKDEMGDFKDEMGDFKDEMRGFKDEMRDFKDETSRFRRESRKQWGELSNKLGTMAEDLVAPSIERILRDTVGCSKEQVESVAVRVRKRHPVTRQRHEFDVVAVGGGYVLINETKSSLDSQAMSKFAEECLPTAREFFPEHAENKFIGAIASLYVDDSLVRYGERLGLIVLGFGEDLMDVLNQPEFTPRYF